MSSFLNIVITCLLEQRIRKFKCRVRTDISQRYFRIQKLGLLFCEVTELMILAFVLFEVISICLYVFRLVPLWPVQSSKCWTGCNNISFVHQVFFTHIHTLDKHMHKEHNQTDARRMQTHSQTHIYKNTHTYTRTVFSLFLSFPLPQTHACTHLKTSSRLHAAVLTPQTIYPANLSAFFCPAPTLLQYPPWHWQLISSGEQTWLNSSRHEWPRLLLQQWLSDVSHNASSRGAHQFIVSPD